MTGSVLPTMTQNKKYILADWTNTGNHYRNSIKTAIISLKTLTCLKCILKLHKVKALKRLCHCPLLTCLPLLCLLCFCFLPFCSRIKLCFQILETKHITVHFKKQRYSVWLKHPNFKSSILLFCFNSFSEFCMSVPPVCFDSEKKTNKKTKISLKKESVNHGIH